MSLEYSIGYIDGQPAGTIINDSTVNGYLAKTITNTVAGTTRITATVGSFTGYADLVFAAGDPASMQVVVSPASITANGTDTAVITATVRDQYDNPVPNAAISFASELGTISGDSFTNLLGRGVASVSGTTAGESVITVTVGALTDNGGTVTFLPGPFSHFDIQASPSDISADGVSTSTITLLLLDINENRINTSTGVTMTTDLGTFDGCGATCFKTTSVGKVEMILTAGTQIGTAHINVVTTMALGTATTVDFTPGPPDHITIEADPPTVVADGISTTTITTTVRDSFENPVDSVEMVGLSISAGKLVTETGGLLLAGPGVITKPTNAAGTKVWYLQSTTELTTSYLTANASGLTPVVKPITFTVGPPSYALPTINPASPITVGVPSAITVTVWDDWGHVVPTTPITIVSWLGAQFLPDTSGDTDSAGQLIRTLYPEVAGDETIGVWDGSKYLMYEKRNIFAR